MMEILMGLRAAELETLKFLDDGPIADGVGREAGELSGNQQSNAETLYQHGLCERLLGWTGTTWHSPTCTGRAVLALVWPLRR